MNKKILTVAAFLAAASLSFGFETWFGADGVEKVNTELGVNEGEYDNSGYWYSYNDAADKGESVVEWDVPAGNQWDDNSLQPVVEECGGVCGHFTLTKGGLSYDPFIGVGFNVGGADAAGKAIPVDASSMKGVCLGYTSTVAATIELGLGDDNDSKIGYANPFVEAKKAASGNVVDVPWSKFAQPSWAEAGQKISIDEAVTKLASIKFKIQAKTGTTGSFNMLSVGDYQGGCTASPSSIGAKAMNSSLKAQLSGRALSFGKAVAKAEIVNLQGQVVMSASSVKTMDLSKLQAGVYMVRAMGLSQQIMLK